MVTDVGGTIGVRVLSTPGMIAMMERCSSILAYENLPDGQGDGRLRGLRQARRRGRARARPAGPLTLREVVDERKLRFDVEVTEGERTIGVGTHERRVIDVGSVAIGRPASLALVLRVSPPETVRIREVGPRDGFQNEPEVIPTAEKVRLIDMLGGGGPAADRAHLVRAPGRDPAARRRRGGAGAATSVGTGSPTRS